MEVSWKTCGRRTPKKKFDPRFRCIWRRIVCACPASHRASLDLSAPNHTINAAFSVSRKAQVNTLQTRRLVPARGLTEPGGQRDRFKTAMGTPWCRAQTSGLVPGAARGIDRCDGRQLARCRSMVVRGAGREVSRGGIGQLDRPSGRNARGRVGPLDSAAVRGRSDARFRAACDQGDELVRRCVNAVSAMGSVNSDAPHRRSVCGATLSVGRASELSRRCEAKTRRICRRPELASSVGDRSRSPRCSEGITWRRNPRTSALLGAQREQRIDNRRAPCGDERRQQRDCQEQERDACIGERVEKRLV